MITISLTTAIAAPPSVVWDELADIERHVEWMADAERIEFTGPQRSDVGTRFVCHTRVGPFRLADTMTVTSWVPTAELAIEHRGLVHGRGAFTLVPDGATGTQFTWREELAFPWWLGGQLTAWCARPVLTAIWRANLDRLRARIPAA